MKNLVIFASGSGSNAEKIIAHFQDSTQVQISHIFCNNSEAGVIARAARIGVPCSIFSREEYKNGTILRKIQSLQTDYIILAGFLWLIPAEFVQAYPNRIINLHPALLPKFGGKGMYGDKVHQAVIASGEKESGITIHLVDEHYDHGKTVFQSTVPVADNETPETLAAKIHELEHRYFPEVIEKWIGGS